MFVDKVEVKGWVVLKLLDRGKLVPGSLREIFFREDWNVWTNEGRQYLAQLMSIASAPSNGFRSDHMAYIGVGIGSQVVQQNIPNLASPVAYTGATFLAPLDIPPTFPLAPTKTTVQYHCLFAENQITLTSPSQVNISEIGLFTDGDPGSGYTPGTRNRALSVAGSQAPNAYQAFEPIGKTDQLAFDVSWQIRF